MARPMKGGSIRAPSPRPPRVRKSRRCKAILHCAGRRSLHGAGGRRMGQTAWRALDLPRRAEEDGSRAVEVPVGDRKSTRLNSSHVARSYAVLWLERDTTPARRLRAVGAAA